MDFLAGAGEMGERIRSFEWQHTPLGPIDSWSPGLKTSVGLMLRSRHPMWIGWGPQMTFLYKDAYLHVLGHAWTAGISETRFQLDTRRSLKKARPTSPYYCTMTPAGKAETGSAGEQPAKEYPAGNSFR